MAGIEYYPGRRIYLRPIELDDEPLLRRWINDPDNSKTLDRFLPVNELREREFIEGLYKSPDDIALAIVLRAGDRLIGVAGLHQIQPASRSAVFGIVIGDRGFQPRGYGTEATRLVVRYGFRELNLNRIGLTVYADHQPAVRAYRRAGFVREGCLRQAFFRNGAYHDAECYGLLRGEWEDCPDDPGEAEDVTPSETPVTALAAMTMWDTRVPA